MQLIEWILSRVKLESETLEVSKGSGVLVFPSESSSTKPESESEPETEPESEPEEEPESEPETESEPESEAEPSSGEKSGVYAGCGSIKSCLGVPDKCLGTSTCRLFASWKK